MMLQDEASKPPTLLSDYMTIAQLAAELGKSPRTVERYFVGRRGPRRTRIGKSVFVKRQDALDWLESLREPAAERKSRRGR
jgi:hypothetical protein